MSHSDESCQAHILNSITSAEDLDLSSLSLSIVTQPETTADGTSSSTSTLSPIQKLAPELLCLVFLEFHEARYEGSDLKVYNGPWSLGWVNRQWRDVALSYPPLWSSISLRFVIREVKPRRERKILESIAPILQEGLSRVGTVELLHVDLFLFLSDPALNFLLDIILPSSSRWMTLSLEFSWGYWDAFLKLPISLDNLQSLKIVHGTCQLPDFIQTNFSTALRLRKVELVNVIVPNMVDLPWSKVESLTLRDPTVNMYGHSHVGDVSLALSRKSLNLLSLLQKTQCLITLDLSHYTRFLEETSFNNPVALPRLCTLHVHIGLYPILSYLHLPALQHVYQNDTAVQYTSDKWTHFVQSFHKKFLPNSESSLTTLSLEMSTMDVVDYLHGLAFFSGTDKLESFQLRITFRPHTTTTYYYASVPCIETDTLRRFLRRIYTDLRLKNQVRRSSSTTERSYLPRLRKFHLVIEDIPHLSMYDVVNPAALFPMLYSRQFASPIVRSALRETTFKVVIEMKRCRFSEPYLSDDEMAFIELFKENGTIIEISEAKVEECFDSDSDDSTYEPGSNDYYSSPEYNTEELSDYSDYSDTSNYESGSLSESEED